MADPLDDELGLGILRQQYPYVIAPPNGTPGVSPKPIGDAPPSLSGQAPPPPPAIGAPDMPTRVPTPGEAMTQHGHDQLSKYQSEGPGWSQIRNPFLRGLAHVGDIAGTILAPGITPRIPGTTMHNEALQAQARGEEAQGTKEQGEEAQTAHTQAGIPVEQAQVPHIQAETREANAEAALKENPPPKEPKFEKVGEDVISLAPGPDGKTQAQVVYHGDPRVETSITKLEIGGEPHQVLVDKNTGKIVQDLGRAGKEAGVSINQGTWSLQEDKDGKPVEYNSRTGQMRPAPEGIASKSEAKFGANERALAQSAGNGLSNMKALAQQDTPAANYAFLMNFIGMSYEGIKGARLNRAEIERAAVTRTLPDQLQHAYDLYVDKKVLTPQQKTDMLKAATALESTYHQQGGGGSGGTVQMKAPDGTVRPVPADQVEHYKSKGAQVVQ